MLGIKPIRITDEQASDVVELPPAQEAPQQQEPREVDDDDVEEYRRFEMPEIDEKPEICGGEELCRPNRLFGDFNNANEPATPSSGPNYRNYVYMAMGLVLLNKLF